MQHPLRTRSHASLLCSLGLLTVTALSGARAWASDSGNLVSDGGFEQGLAGFFAGSTAVSVARTTTAPLSGSGSLALTLGGYGNIWWGQNVGSASALAQSFTVTADLRADVVNTSDPIQLCATIYYTSGTFAGNCVAVAQTVGAVQHLQAVLALDASQPLRDIHVRVSALGSATVRYTMDNVTAVLTSPGTAPPPSQPPPSQPPPSQPPPSQPPPSQPPPPTGGGTVSSNLVADPGFETSASGFAPQQTGDSATSSTSAPLTGHASLKITEGPYDSIWWFYSPSGSAVHAQQVSAAADVRIDSNPSGKALQLCAVAYYGSNMAQSCASAPTGTGVVTHLAPTLTTDPAQTITRTGFRLIGGDGGSAISATLDSASFFMTTGSTSQTPPPPPPPNGYPADIVAYWGSPRQTIDGFGASNVDHDAALSGADADLFFSTQAGIGLSILRVGITDTGDLRGGGWGDGALVAARGGRVVAVPWTAPGAWKSNGSTTNGGTLISSHYSDWATTMAGFVNTFKANSGVDLYAVSIQNEPNLAVPYESMLYSVDQLAAFAKVLSPKLAAMSPRPKLMMGEYSTWDGLDGLTGYLVSNDPTALGMVNIFGIHQYGSTAPTPWPGNYSQPLWQTEVSSFGSFDASLTNGLQTAQWLHDALTTGNVTAWLYWWLYGQGTDNEGLVGSTDHPRQLTKRYYALGNFSKFVRPGWVRVATTGSKSGLYGVSAYKSAATGAYAFVVVNSSSAAVTVNLGMANATGYSTVVPYQTTDDGSGNMTMGVHGNLEPRAAISVAADGTFTATVPRGVTTFVGSAH